MSNASPSRPRATAFVLLVVAVLFSWARLPLSAEPGRGAEILDAAPQMGVTVPFLSHFGDGYPLVDLVLGEEVEPRRFLLDPCEGFNFLSEDAAHASGAKLQPLFRSGQEFSLTGEVPATFPGGRQPLQYAAFPRIAAGGFSVGETGFVVEPGSTFYRRGWNNEIVGRLGRPFLREVVTLIDFQRQTLTFWRPENFSDVERAASGFGDVRPIALQPGWRIPVRLDDTREYPVALSFTSRQTGVPREMARDLGMRSHGERRLEHSLGTDRLERVWIESLSIGGMEHQGIPGVYRTTERAWPLTERIGMNLLRRYRVLLVPHEQKLYLQPIGVDEAEIEREWRARSEQFQRRRPLSLVWDEVDPEGRVLLNARISDEFEARLVLDTGSPHNALRDTLARKLGEPRTGLPEPEFQQGDLRTMSCYIANRVTTEGLEFENVPFIAMPDAMLDRRLKLPIDGLLGTSVLRHHALLFDFGTRKLSVWPGGWVSRDERRAAGLDGAFSVPLTDLNGSFQYSVPVRINDLFTVNSILDSGANASLVARPVAAHLGLQPLRVRASARTVHGEGAMHAASVEALAIGGGPAVRPADGLMFWPRSSKDEGVTLLGLDVLSQFRVLIDFPAHRAYFLPLEEADR